MYICIGRIHAVGRYYIVLASIFPAGAAVSIANRRDPECTAAGYRVPASSTAILYYYNIIYCTPHCKTGLGDTTAAIGNSTGVYIYIYYLYNVHTYIYRYICRFCDVLHQKKKKNGEKITNFLIKITKYIICSGV